LSTAHERYTRLFVNQRIRDVFERIDKNTDGCIDEGELFEYLELLEFPATKSQVRDMVWEVDDKSEGYLTLESISALLKRLQKAKIRGVGTGSNLLRNLFEYMIFDTDFSGEIDVEEVQQMFFVYYGFKGQLLDQTVRNFQRLRENPAEEIKFEEFSTLMDKLALKPALQDRVAAPPKRRRIMPKYPTRPFISRPHSGRLGMLPSRHGGAHTARTFGESSWETPQPPPSSVLGASLCSQLSPRYNATNTGVAALKGMSPPGSISALSNRVKTREQSFKKRREDKYKRMSKGFMNEYDDHLAAIKLRAEEEKEQVREAGMRLANI